MMYLYDAASFSVSYFKPLMSYNTLFYKFTTVLVMFVLSCDISMAQNLILDDKQDAQKRLTRQPVNIEITTHLGDQQVFVENDAISFFINIDKPAFVYVFYQDASGIVFQLMPGKAQLNHFLNPGFYIPFPAKKSSFQFVVSAPFGKEQLWIFASDQAELKLKTESNNQGLIRVNQTYSELESYINEISKLIFSKNKLSIYTKKAE